MLELIASPQIIGLLAVAFSLIAGISLSAHFLERKKRRKSQKLGR